MPENINAPTKIFGVVKKVFLDFELNKNKNQ